ncbi:MAG: D-glucuronyl C5-epimerase family protein [Candidatus Limnocylindrales bacterium]
MASGSIAPPSPAVASGSIAPPSPADPTPAADRLPCVGWSDALVPPPTIRVGHVVDNVTTRVATVPLRRYVEVVLATSWPADAPPTALAAAAIAIRQAAWFRAMEPTFKEGPVDGSCFDLADDEVGMPYRPTSPVPSAVIEAVQATWSLVLRKSDLEAPFFQPRIQSGVEDRCGTPVAPIDTVLPQRGVIACARGGMSATQILHQYLDPDLAIYDASAAPPIGPGGPLLDAWMGLRDPWGVELTDRAGIPMAVHGGVARYSPVQISQWGLAQYQRWLETGAAGARDAFLAMSDWLVANQLSDGRWLYDFPFGTQPTPWWSGMAEGEGMSLLLRAHQVTGRQAYLSAATKALSTIGRDAVHGGVANTVAGSLWIEEYMPPYSEHTLNGMLFAIEGVREYALVTGDATATRVAAQALETVATWLPRFDAGTWSYYNLAPAKSNGKTLPGELAPFHYHLIQLGELRHFYLIGRDPRLLTYIERWAHDAADPPPGG